MRIIQTLDEMTETARGWLAGGSVGFVPTMGYLHAGHLSLVEAARKACEISVVSIFVNPLQFATRDEFEHYPRDLTRDIQLLRTAQVDIVFAPREEDFYPPDFCTHVIPSGPLLERLERGEQYGFYAWYGNCYHEVAATRAARCGLFWAEGYSAFRYRAPHCARS